VGPPVYPGQPLLMGLPADRGCRGGRDLSGLLGPGRRRCLRLGPTGRGAVALAGGLPHELPAAALAPRRWLRGPLVAVDHVPVPAEAPGEQLAAFRARSHRSASVTSAEVPVMVTAHPASNRRPRGNTTEPDWAVVPRTVSTAAVVLDPL